MKRVEIDPAAPVTDDEIVVWYPPDTPALAQTKRWYLVGARLRFDCSLCGRPRTLEVGPDHIVQHVQQAPGFRLPDCSCVEES